MELGLFLLGYNGIGLKRQIREWESAEVYCAVFQQRLRRGQRTASGGSVAGGCYKTLGRVWPYLTELANMSARKVVKVTDMKLAVASAGSSVACHRIRTCDDKMSSHRLGIGAWTISGRDTAQQRAGLLQQLIHPLQRLVTTARGRQLIIHGFHCYGL
jgi:hypothetical protein